MDPTPAQATPIAAATERLGLQPAGAFLTQQHAHSPPMAIPPPRNGAVHRTLDAPTAQGAATSSSFLAAIRRGLQDNSPSWDNNGWFIGDDSDDEDDDDSDFYSSMAYPYSGAAEATAAYTSCAPAGSFAGFGEGHQPSFGLVDLDGAAAAANVPIHREGSLIFAMEV